MTFQTGFIPKNKIHLTSEQQQFLTDNYKTKTTPELAKTLGFKPSFVKKTLRRLNLKRDPVDVANLRQTYYTGTVTTIAIGKNKKVTIKTLSPQSKIEGGTKNRWHREKWEKANSKIPSGFILTYTGGTSFENLELIKRSEFDRRNKTKNKQQLEEQLKTQKEKERLQKEEQRKQKELAWVRFQFEDKFEDKIRRVQPKSFSETVDEMKSKGFMPVRLDHKTIVFRKIKNDKP